MAVSAEVGSLPTRIARIGGGDVAQVTAGPLHYVRYSSMQFSYRQATQVGSIVVLYSTYTTPLVQGFSWGVFMVVRASLQVLDVLN